MQNGRTIFITGVAGFLGKHTALQFCQNEFRVIGFDISPPPFEHRNLTFIRGSILDSELLAFHLINHRPLYFLHMAGLIKSDSSRALFEANVFGAYSVCNSIASAEIDPRLILVSSGAVYKPSKSKIAESSRLEPITEYGLTKMFQEEIFTNFANRQGLENIVFRPFNIIGPGMPRTLSAASIICRLQAAKASGLTEIEIGNMNSVRDFIDVRDVARIIYSLSQGDSKLINSLNICSGTGYKIGDIFGICCDIIDYHPRVIIQDYLLQQNDVPYHVGSDEKLRSFVGTPLLYNLRESVYSMMDG